MIWEGYHRLLIIFFLLQFFTNLPKEPEQSQIWITNRLLFSPTFVVKNESLEHKSPNKSVALGS